MNTRLNDEYLAAQIEQLSRMVNRWSGDRTRYSGDIDFILSRYDAILFGQIRDPAIKAKAESQRMKEFEEYTNEPS